LPAFPTAANYNNQQTAKKACTNASAALRLFVWHTRRSIFVKSRKGGECCKKKRCAFFFCKMISSRNGQPLALKLVMLTAARPKDLVCWTRVCKNWRDELRKDEYWYKFRNYVLKELPCLKEVFQNTPASGRGSNIWSVFVHRLWPLARNLHKTAMHARDLNAHVLTAVLMAYFVPPPQAAVHSVEFLNPGTASNVYGGARFSLDKENTWTVLFKSETDLEAAIRDMNVLKLQRLAGKHQKRKRTFQMTCSISQNRKFNRHVPPREFFRPYLMRVFGKNI